MEEFEILVLLDFFDETEHINRRDIKLLRYCSGPFSLNESEFIKNFRLNKYVCKTLIEELEPLATHETSIPFTLRFLAALYFFSAGSYQKCVGNNLIAPMSQSSVSRCTKEISQLIVERKGFEVSFPQSNDEITAVKTGFYRQFGIKATLGVIDCTHIAIVSPPANNRERPLSLYMNRKGYYSINVEAVCDHRLIFTSVNAKFPGSCHDSGIWCTSPVRAHIRRAANASDESWLIGDQGYPLEPWLLTPFAEPIGGQQVKYNRIHAKARNVIERAFGVLKSRFRCLSRQRILYYSHERAANIIYACMILHNIIRKCCPSEDIEVTEIEQEVEPLPSNYDCTFHREGERVRNRYVLSL